MLTQLPVCSKQKCILYLYRAADAGKKHFYCHIYYFNNKTYTGSRQKWTEKGAATSGETENVGNAGMLSWWFSATADKASRFGHDLPDNGHTHFCCL